MDKEINNIYLEEVLDKVPVLLKWANRALNNNNIHISQQELACAKDSENFLLVFLTYLIDNKILVSGHKIHSLKENKKDLPNLMEKVMIYYRFKKDDDKEHPLIDEAWVAQNIRKPVWNWNYDNELLKKYEILGWEPLDNWNSIYKGETYEEAYECSIRFHTRLQNWRNNKKCLE